LRSIVSVVIGVVSVWFRGVGVVRLLG
jgi:hypothetical protein